MFARLLMFALVLLAGWLIWRAVRRWIDMSAAKQDNRTDTRRLDHQRHGGSAAGWTAAGASGVAVGGDSNRGEDLADARSINTHEAPHDSGAETDGGSDSGSTDGGSGGD